MFSKLFGKRDKKPVETTQNNDRPNISDEKVPCVKCGKIILKRMAVLNGGKCTSCTTTIAFVPSLFDSNPTFTNKMPASMNEESRAIPSKDSANENFTRAETLKIPDPWGIGGVGPFTVEREPDIDAILSAPNPTPPKPAADWNKYYERSAEETRGYLAMAYLRHPSTEVREATIRFVGSRSKKELSVGLVLAQRLAVDTDKYIRMAAGEAIWNRGQEELLETMKYLAGNDEKPGDDGNGEFVSQTQVRAALQTLHDNNLANLEDFRNALLFAWCRQNKELAELGQRLEELWMSNRTFTRDQSKDIAREIGVKLHEIGGLDAMRMMFRPITMLVGSDAASDLNFAWSDIGGWLP
jgi:hypothetical protein